MSEAQTKPDEIELRGKTISDVPDEERTEGKDDAARYILNEVLAEDRWPMDYKEMGDEAGWSREHMRKTVKTYFKPAEENNRSNMTNTAERVEDQFIPIPGDIENVGDYLEGVRQGMKLS